MEEDVFKTESMFSSVVSQRECAKDVEMRGGWVDLVFLEQALSIRVHCGYRKHGGHGPSITLCR